MNNIRNFKSIEAKEKNNKYVLEVAVHNSTKLTDVDIEEGAILKVLEVKDANENTTHVDLQYETRKTPADYAVGTGNVLLYKDDKNVPSLTFEEDSANRFNWDMMFVGGDDVRDDRQAQPIKVGLMSDGIFLQRKRAANRRNDILTVIKKF